MNTPAYPISRDELLALVQASAPGFRLVEALPARYYEEAHLPGALNLPLDGIEGLAPALLPDKAAPVVTYCASASCENSTEAAGHLRRLGYQDVREYRGGKEDWIAAGLPVERGAAATAEQRG